MQKDVTFSEKERTLTAYLKCDIDHHTAKRMRERIDSELFLKKPELLVIDFSAVEFMDSSGISLIYNAYKIAKEFGQSVNVFCENERFNCKFLFYCFFSNFLATFHYFN